MLMFGRVIGGIGGSTYPLTTFVSEHVGKKHRTYVNSWILGVGRSLG